MARERARSSPETIQIGGLQEQPAPDGLIATDTHGPLIVLIVALLDQRAVAGEEHRSWSELVRGQEIGEHLRPRAVVLRDGAEEEMAGELIRGLRIEDVERVDALAGRFALERDPLEVDLFRKAAARLKGESSRQIVRSPLVRRHGIVERREAAVGVRIHAQPPEQLCVALQAPPPDLESLSRKRLVSGDLIEPYESRPREEQTHALQREELVAALNHIVRRLIERERCNPPQPGPLGFIRIEIDLAVQPAVRLADPVDERRVHLEAAVVVFEMAAKRPAFGLVAVARLRTEA